MTGARHVRLEWRHAGTLVEEQIVSAQERRIHIHQIDVAREQPDDLLNDTVERIDQRTRQGDQRFDLRDRVLIRHEDFRVRQAGP